MWQYKKLMFLFFSPSLLARTSKGSLFTSDLSATGKFSEIPLETSENLLETS